MAATTVGRHMACFAATRGVASGPLARASVARASGQRSALSGGRLALPAAMARRPRDAPPGRPRTFVVTAGKKGFAELLGNLAAPKDEGDFQGRPRLTKGKVSAKQHVPPGIPKPPYADSGFLPDMSERPQVHDAEGIEKMRAAGLLAAQVLDFAESIVKPGITTDYIDRQVHKMIVDAGAYPSPLNYGGFPKSVCTSLNECICHGIPDTTELMEGDIINIDVTVYLDGHHGDTSRTVCVGKVTDEARVGGRDGRVPQGGDRRAGPACPCARSARRFTRWPTSSGTVWWRSLSDTVSDGSFIPGPPSDTTATTTRANSSSGKHSPSSPCSRSEGRTIGCGRTGGRR